MIEKLYIENIGGIRGAELTFTRGLNVITGETGAGKSLVIGSVELALGGKASGSIVRHGEDEASVELVFEAESERECALMKELGIEIEDDGLVIMSRKLKENRSAARINGDTVNTSVLKKAASTLIDIHGQRDQMGLLSKRNLCAILDRYAGDDVAEPLIKVEECYVNYKDLIKEPKVVENQHKARKFIGDVMEKSGKEVATKFATYALGKGINKLVGDEVVKGLGKSGSDDEKDKSKQVEKILNRIASNVEKLNVDTPKKDETKPSNEQKNNAESNTESTSNTKKKKKRMRPVGLDEEGSRIMWYIENYG